MSKEKIIHRFKIINGHVQKIVQMLEDDKYCMDVLHQADAVKKAISKAEADILDQHLNSCVVKDIQSGNKKAIDEILMYFNKVSK